MSENSTEVLLLRVITFGAGDSVQARVRGVVDVARDRGNDFDVGVAGRTKTPLDKLHFSMNRTEIIPLGDYVD